MAIISITIEVEFATLYPFNQKHALVIAYCQLTHIKLL